MSLINELKRNNVVVNSKGGLYYRSTYNANLDVFSMLSRYDEEEKIINLFKNALEEDAKLALANLMYLLDIRGGKGERRLFKIIYKYLCDADKEFALKIMPYVGELGRYDYLLEGLHTSIEKETIEQIKNKLNSDINSDVPSLLAKWLPSIRNHNKTNDTAKYLASCLGYSEKEYRKILSSLRTKLNIVEKNLTNKKYENIILSQVPTKAMLKYNNAFNIHMNDQMIMYKAQLKDGNTTINTKGLFPYEVIKKSKQGVDEVILDEMWKNQTDLFEGNDKNILVIADTSGSMTCLDSLPLYNSLGLAIYCAERNHGAFNNYFISFSDEPQLEEIKGKTIRDKIRNIRSYIGTTNINKVFRLILEIAVEAELSQTDLPEDIIIISDMEFDDACSGKPNFQVWQQEYNEKGYKLPKIIFWNVAGRINGAPATQYDKNMIMVSGFSTNILKGILNNKIPSPVELMVEVLNPYIKLVE